MPRPCVECGEAPKVAGHPKWCAECRLRHRPMVEQIAAADARLAAVPMEQRRGRVSAREWPKGRRWCAGCQSFRSLRDVGGKGASRCRPCASRDAHASRLRFVYGIDAPEYDRILAVQGGLCAICRTGQRYQRLTVDHDHRTGQVRGLLCKRCNHDLLGAAHESPRILAHAIHYLTNPPASGSWAPAAEPEEA